MLLLIKGVLFLLIVLKLVELLLRSPRQKNPTAKTKYILITGCDYGFGNLFAKRLDFLGFSVFAGCLTERGASELQSSCRRLVALRMDVTDDASIQSSYRTVEAAIGPHSGLWAVVNNAGVLGSPGMTEWFRREDFQRVLDVNLLGMMSVLRAFLPLVKRVRGRVVNTASMVGRIPFPCSAPYVISKYAVEGYCDVIRRELKAFGVSVHIIEPGAFKTPFINTDTLAAATSHAWEALPEQLKEEYGHKFFCQLRDLMYKTVPLWASGRTDYVVSAYEHAVLSYWPRARYIPGWDAALLGWPLTFAPEWFTDTVFSAIMPSPAAPNLHVIQQSRSSKHKRVGEM